MEKNPRIGVLAALGVCVLSGIATPLVSFLKVFRTEEMLMVRGLFAMVASLIILHFRVKRPGWKLLASACVLGAATFSYYQAVRHWGVNLTMVVLTTAPIVNFILQRFRGVRVQVSSMIALFFIVIGAAFALQPWHGNVNMPGLIWSFASVVFTGVGLDFLGQTSGDVFNRVFWFGLIYAAAGFSMCYLVHGLPFVDTDMEGKDIFLLAIFGVASAGVYVGNIYTFDNLRRDVASVLNASSVVPIIVGAWLVTGETLAFDRLCGAGLSFVAATILSYVESQHFVSPDDENIIKKSDTNIDHDPGP